MRHAPPGRSQSNAEPAKTTDRLASQTKTVYEGIPIWAD